jgi:hypothetical protein
MRIQSCTPTLINNTITQNRCTSSSTSSKGGGLNVYSGSFTGVNNIVYDNYATTNPEFYGTVNFNYSCSSVAFSGGAGNIVDNPQFVSPGEDNFNLTPGSPCIDAGDPASPLDPDGSRADLGAFYFDQGSASPVSITLAPLSLPILIPATGGNFNFNATLANSGTSPQTIAVWIMVRLPNQAWYGPMLGPLNLTLSGGASFTRLRTQNIPGSAPAGTYLYEGRVGLYPDSLWDHDGFNFLKLGGANGTSVDWSNWGQTLDQESEAPSQLVKNGVGGSVSPNPFNPSTAASYKVQVASHVSLKVYDTAGRLVATLAEGWREAGEYKATFDGSGLPSGMYVYRLQAGEKVATGKMVLLK